MFLGYGNSNLSPEETLIPFGVRAVFVGVLLLFYVCINAQVVSQLEVVNRAP